MKLRKDPRRGEVITTQVHEGLCAYLVFYESYDFYLCDFLSRGLISDMSQFGREHWVPPLDKNGQRIHPNSPHGLFSVVGMPTTFRTVGFIELTEEEAFPWEQSMRSKFSRFWEHTDEDVWQDCIANGRVKIDLSKEEAARYVNQKQTYWDKFPEFILSLGNQFQVVEGNLDMLPPPPLTEEDTDVDFELDFQGGVSVDSTEVEDAISDAADHEAISLECMGSDGFRCDSEEASMALSVIRRALKRILPKTEWDFVQIIRRGPEIGKERTYGLLPTPRKKAE